MSLANFLFGGSSRFRRNFIGFASANVIAQIVGVISLPFLSRLYSPKDFGVLTTFTLVQSIFLAFVTFRFDWIMPNSKGVRQADRLLASGIVTTLTFSLIVLVFVSLFQETLTLFLRLPQGSYFVRYVPFGIFGGGILMLLQARNVFHGDLSAVSRAKVSQALATLFASILFGLTTYSEFGLVLSYVFGFFVAILTMRRDLNASLLSLKKTEVRSLVRIFRNYRTQIASTVGLALANVIMTSSPILLLIIFYDSIVVGWYGLVFRVATAPIGLVTTALVQSFWSDAADLVKRNPYELRNFYLGTVGRLAVLALPFLVASILGPFYIPKLFGEQEWSGAGHLLLAISPYLVGMIVFSPTTHLVVYRKAHWQLIIDLLTLVSTVFVFSLLATLGYEAWISLLGSSVVMLLGYLVRFWAHFKAHRMHIASIG